MYIYTTRYLGYLYILKDGVRGFRWQKNQIIFVLLENLGMSERTGIGLDEAEKGVGWIFRGEEVV